MCMDVGIGSLQDKEQKIHHLATKAYNIHVPSVSYELYFLFHSSHKQLYELLLNVAKDGSGRHIKVILRGEERSNYG